MIEEAVRFIINIPFALFGAEAPEWLVFVHLSVLYGGVFMLGFISILAFASVWAERKVSGYMQARYGPMEVGKYHGWLQTIADAVKLLFKEDILPAAADKPLFTIAPMLVFAGSLMSYVAIPFGPNLKVADLDIGVFYILGTSAVVVVGIIIAGWSSYSKWSIYGGMRAAAQYVSYEIPTALHLMPVIVMAGSLNLIEIADQQKTILTWNVWPWINPFATVSFIMYYIAALAETNRTPFDLAESESELVAGTHTEYSGIRWSFFFLAEYADMFVVSALGVILFLGGWHVWPIPVVGPYLAPFFFLLKVFLLMFVAIWLRWTLPRLRVDQLTYLCWKVLLPFGMVTVTGTALWQLYFYKTIAGYILGTLIAVAIVWAMVVIYKSEPIPSHRPPMMRRDRMAATR